jgi:hypothetical protein
LPGRGDEQTGGKLLYGIEAVARPWRKIHRSQISLTLLHRLKMLFLIRAIFWLSIVSYFLPWPEDKIALLLTKSDVKSEAQDILGRTVGMAQAAAERECLRA